MPARFYVFASFVAASSLLGLADPASAGDGKICGKNQGGYVAEYKVTFTTDGVHYISTGFNQGTAIGDKKCYTASDAYGNNVIPKNLRFTMSVTAQGGTGAGKYDTCTPSNQLYSATGSTITYKSSGTTTNVTCQK